MFAQLMKKKPVSGAQERDAVEGTGPSVGVLALNQAAVQDYQDVRLEEKLKGRKEALNGRRNALFIYTYMPLV